MGLSGPGAVVFSFTAHGLFGGIHHGFHSTRVMAKLPRGVLYRGIPGATRIVITTESPTNASSRYAGMLTTTRSCGVVNPASARAQKRSMLATLQRPTPSQRVR